MKWPRAVVLVLALALAGCASHNTVTNLPPGVSQVQVNNWKSAADNLKMAQDGSHAALEAALNLHNSGAIKDSPGYGIAITAIGRADQLEIEAAAFLKSVPNDWSQPTKQKLASYTTQILMQLASANETGVLGVKNPANGKVVSDMIADAMKVMQLVQVLTASRAEREFQREVAYV